MKCTVIYHRADFDGLFCREIARKFLPADTEFIGWDFGDKPLSVPGEGLIYIMDLPVDRVFGLDFGPEGKNSLLLDHTWLYQVIWIDHHKSSIESHPTCLPGYRIDGVAACRLVWQWFYLHVERGTAISCLPTIEEYVERSLIEPLAVRLAGEYDIWDKRDPRAGTFQFGLRSAAESLSWALLLGETGSSQRYIDMLMADGARLQRYQREQDASVMSRAFEVKFEGLTFLALNTARCNSLTFESAAQPQHDGLMGFYFNGKEWVVSLYHSPHHKEHDLSAIARKFGGGGHKGACGFRCGKLPFQLPAL